MFRWLKRTMPRGLYGRAFLILLLPVISLLLVVSVVSAQRLFEGVTRQMTTSVSREVRLMLDAPDPAPIAEALAITIGPVALDQIPRENVRRWYDITGIILLDEIETLLPRLRAVDLGNTQIVHLYFVQDGQGTRMTVDRRRFSASNPHQLFVNMLFFGVLMTVIAYLYLRNQLRPITRLARAAEAFGRGRNVPYRPSGANEVRAAGSAFLDMRARIERQIEQRTLMLSGVSHDLRTPLTRLKLSLEMLEDEDEREPMLRDVRDMERLLDAFLDFARGTAEGEAEEVDPAQLIRRIAEDCERASIPATIHEISGEGTVPLRPVALRRAIENLIGNAVRYGTRAELSMVLSERALRITIEDDGPGIPEDRREEALRPFARLEPSRNQDKGPGVGLGLSIATDIVRAHGGALRLGTSERLGGLRADLVIGR
ncbi:ATP-binding protein [Roseovarius nanhaiticus]|uniref:histidine kinase n=1 Tax=Roseovarius nanhaiticus TaxID=573024 RepID=A0A1N7HJ16_9RHOB|nr:ATP-binding protein [Roseovarius nanhaiticus]SEK91917.1 two-component system, OmpR family, osmolarity sensor histidine kinase EnvZ [Roseovarius nanhaiticus]SIS24680.1 two-component system, OmpR family, osmolarity sensor histidine kinase EnvZ [Roseovarius nanhaiticus]